LLRRRDICRDRHGFGHSLLDVDSNITSSLPPLLRILLQAEP
jgi:hypothetical protein